MKLTPLSLSGNFSIKNIIEEGDCPNCGVRVKMLVVETSVVSKIYHAPIKKFRKNYLAICPHCTKKYKLVSEKFKKHFLLSSYSFTTNDLIEFEESKPLVDITF